MVDTGAWGILGKINYRAPKGPVFDPSKFKLDLGGIDYEAPDWARPQEQKQAVSDNDRKPFRWEPGEQFNFSPVGNTDIGGGGGRQLRDDIPESTYRDGPPQKSLAQILLERLDQQYQRPNPSKMDMSALDSALKERLGAIGGIRDQVQGNFNTSAGNLEAMHRAFENQVRNEDAARYNQIADTNKANLQGNANQAIGSIEGARAKAVAERQAMLKNLGIEAAGAAEDPGNEIYNRGINTVNERLATGQNLAEGQRATNLAYNNTVAQSIGQQGLARRAALEQQLQGILGKLSMAESDAKVKDQEQRASLANNADQQAYKMWNDQQNRTLDLFNTVSGQELAREKMMNGGESKPARGLSSIAADLQASGIDPGAAQNGLAALGKILSEGNYLQGYGVADNQGNVAPYDRTNALVQKLKAEGVDPMTATQIAIGYDKL